jgi:AcrR family transcriptional regulator
MSQFKKNEVKEKIEEAALDLFFNKGYSDTSINDICKEAKTSVGNIYRYFSNKADIYDALISKEFLDILKNNLIKRTNILHKTQFDISISINEKDWYETEYFDFLTNNKKKLVVFYLYTRETNNDATLNEIIQDMMKAKLSILNLSDNSRIPHEYINTATLLIKSNIVLNIEILAQDIAAQELKILLKNIDLYHLKGISALWNKWIYG